MSNLKKSNLHLVLFIIVLYAIIYSCVMSISDEYAQYGLTDDGGDYTIVVETKK